MTKWMTITRSGHEIRSKYSDKAAELYIHDVTESKRIGLEEWDCDALLRVVEHSATPMLDLVEYFTEACELQERVAYAIAEHFTDLAPEIAKHVYAS